MTRTDGGQADTRDGRRAVGGAGPALDNSSAYLEAAGHIVVAWLWLDQVLALGDRGDAFAAGKRQTALYFFEWELPKALTQLALVERLDSVPRDMLDEWF